MKNTEAHPIDLLLLALVVVIEAAITLAVAAAALVLALWPPARVQDQACTGTPTVMPPPPALHPLAAMAEQLTTDLTRRQLQQLAGTKANLSKATLAGMVMACS